MSKLREMLYKMVEESINELNTSAGVGYFNTPKAFKKRPLNEISYRKYNQTINNTTPKHKIRKSLRELRKYVKEINTLIDFNNRLKLEMGENNTHHWDSIKEQLDELSKELLQIGKKIKTLHR